MDDIVGMEVEDAGGGGARDADDVLDLEAEGGQEAVEAAHLYELGHDRDVRRLAHPQQVHDVLVQPHVLPAQHRQPPRKR